MNKAPKIILKILLIIAAYFLGLILSISVTTLPHINLALRHQLKYSSELAGEITVEQPPSNLEANNKLMLYSPDKELLWEKDLESNPIPYRCEKLTGQYFARYPGEEFSCPTIILENLRGSFSDRIDVVAFVARSVELDGEDYYLVLIKDLVSDVFFITNSSIGFTCIFISFLFCVLIIRKKQKTMELLRRNYIDNVTHELKTPMVSVKALVSALNDHDMDQAQRSEYYGLILAEANKHQHMVQNILELSRLQSKGVSFKKASHSAVEILGPTIDRYVSLCDDLSISFSAANISTLPRLMTNPDCIQRLLDILLGNAIRFTDDSAAIELCITNETRHLVVGVRDNGPGIPAKDLPHVFERFFRGETSYSKGGNGLGLAIAKELSIGLGEKIWVESHEGQGSTFYFTIKKA